jgi:ubiquinol-cytochrome c reductase cytochrome b subunit
MMQIISGYFISCFYTKEYFSAFRRVDRLNRDIKFGSIIRHIHIFGARAFFFFMYLHMGRALYYKSFIKKIYAWIRGVILYFLLIITSFVGYVLP